MMELMARNGSILSPSDAKKRRLQEARSRPMPKAARMKLEMKMEPEAEEGPDSDEEMMALLDPGRSGIPSTENRKVQVGKLQRDEANVSNIALCISLLLGLWSSRTYIFSKSWAAAG